MQISKEQFYKKLRPTLIKMVEEANYDIEWVEGQLKNKVSVSDINQGLQAWSVGGISAECVLENLLREKN